MSGIDRKFLESKVSLRMECLAANVAFYTHIYIYIYIYIYMYVYIYVYMYIHISNIKKDHLAEDWKHEN